MSNFKKITSAFLVLTFITLQTPYNAQAVTNDTSIYRNELDHVFNITQEPTLNEEGIYEAIVTIDLRNIIDVPEANILALVTAISTESWFFRRTLRDPSDNTVRGVTVSHGMTQPGQIGRLELIFLLPQEERFMTVDFNKTNTFDITVNQ